MTNSILSAKRAIWLRLLDILGGHVQPSINSADLFTGSSNTLDRLNSNLDDEEALIGVVAKFPLGGEAEIPTELRCWKNPDFKVCMATFYLTPVKLMKCREKSTMVLWHSEN